MKNAFAIFVLISLCCCKSKDCSALNYKLIAEFERQINTVKKAKNIEEVFVVEYRDALIYLSSTTGIMTRSEFGDVPLYVDHQDFEHDIKTWESWLKAHRCLEKEKVK